MGRLLRWFDSWIPKDPVQVLVEQQGRQLVAYQLTLQSIRETQEKNERRLRHTQPEFWGGGRREPEPWRIVSPWELPG